MSLIRRAAMGLVLVSWASFPAWAQDKDQPAKAAPVEPATKAASTTPAAPEEPPVTADQFPELLKAWLELDDQLNTMANQFLRAPTTEEKNVIRGRYVKLVEQSEKLLPKLRLATEAAFAAAPGQDKLVTEYMIKFLAYDTRAYQSGKQDYEQAYQQSKLLIEAKIDDPVLFALAGAAAFEMDDYDQAEKWLTIAKEANKLDVQAEGLLKELPARREAWAKEQELRQQEAAADDLPRVKLETTKGTIVLELFENQAPQTVGNFVNLVEKKYYDGLTFHRVLPGFMAQGGDPLGTGGGGPGYTIPDECSREDHRRHFRGSLSMAKTAAPDSGGSQFFIAYHATTHLDGKHTVFGRVIEGMDVVTRLQETSSLPPPGAPAPAVKPPAPDKIVKAEVLRKREHEYVPTKVEPKAPASGDEKTKGKAGEK